MGMFTSWAIPFWAYLVQKFKFVQGKLLPRLIWIYRTQWRCSLHLFKAGNILLEQVWSKKMKIVSFSWNSIHSLAQIWRTQWWSSLFLFFSDTFFMANLFQKIKIVCWNWNLELRPIWLCKIRCSFFSALDLSFQVLPKKSIWHIDVTWLISRQVISFKIIT